MGRKPGSNQRIKLISAIGLSMFSLVAVAVSSVAWFTAMRRTGSDGTMRVTSTEKRFKKITLHNVVFDDYVNGIYKFDRNPVATATYIESTGQVSYSPNFTIVMDTYNDLEQNHPVLMLVELNGTITATEEEPLTVYASSTSTEYFGIAKADGTPKNEIKRSGNPLSSVVNFFSKSMMANDTLITTVGSYTDYSEEEPVIYQTYDFPMVQYKPAYAGFDRESFVQFNDETMEYQDFIQNKNLLQMNSGSAEYIAIIVDYYHPAVEYVYSTFMSEEVLDDTIYFSCDWSMVI